MGVGVDAIGRSPGRGQPGTHPPGVERGKGPRRPRHDAVGLPCFEQTLVLGALSFRSPRIANARLAVGGLGAAVVLGAISFGFSLLWSPGLTGFAVRNGARSLTLALALLLCAWVFFQRARATRSWAALVTGIACLGYGLDQVVYIVVDLGQVLNAMGLTSVASSIAVLSSATVLYADLALTSVICLGMVLFRWSRRSISDRSASWWKARIAASGRPS